MPHDGAETVPPYGIWTSFQARQPRRSISWARLPAGLYYFMIRRRTHCLPQASHFISGTAGNIGCIQPSGWKVDLTGGERICRIFAISCQL